MKMKLATSMVEDLIVKSVATEIIHIRAGVMLPLTFFVTTCVSLPELMQRIYGSTAKFLNGQLDCKSKERQDLSNNLSI